MPEPFALSFTLASPGLSPALSAGLSLTLSLPLAHSIALLGVAHGLYNFHIVPSRARSQPSAGERAAGSLAPVAARMKESGAL